MVVMSGVGAAAGDGAEKVVAAHNGAGVKLYRQLAKAPGNVLISPYGIGTAMAMALAGARGKTEAEMRRVLGHQLQRAEIPAADAELRAALLKRAGKDGVKLASVNALHLMQMGDAVRGAYKDLLTGKYGAELFEGSDLSAINGWVKDKTEGRIDEILTRLDPRSVCVLLNAVYFKGSWAVRFDEKETRPGDFHLSKTETIKVPLMRRSGSFLVVRNDSFQAIALPYAGGALSMIVLLPPAGKELSALEKSLDAKTIGKAMSALGGAEPQALEIVLPRFKSAFGADLIEPFERLGMKRPFRDGQADFSGMVESSKKPPPVYISQIRHKTFVEVNEEGTEAAAATAVETGVRSIKPDPAAFRVDRPFLYLIADRATGALLFLGRIVDPRPKKN